jgi:hypothetical protein
MNTRSIVGIVAAVSWLQSYPLKTLLRALPTLSLQGRLRFERETVQL